MQGRTWVGLVVAVAVLAVPSVARAGSYRVWACRLPSGAPAPTHDASSGWVAELRAGTQFMTLDDTCASGGGIHAHLGGQTPPLGSGGSWHFLPPPGTSLGGFSITWSGVVGGGGEATLSRSDQPDPVYVERNGASFAAHTVTQGGFDIAALTAIAACSFANPCGADPVDFTITRAVMTLNDFRPPLVSHASGGLLSKAKLRGTMSVALTGSDVGGGLYRVLVVADDRFAVGGAVPDASGRCRDVNPADGHAFAWPQPCPASFQGIVPVDTRGLPNGRHRIAVVLEDAAGNRTLMGAPRVRTVANKVARGAINGINGGDGARLTRRGPRRLTTGFRHRRPVLRGRLTRAGKPVERARLLVLARNQVPGARLRRIATTVTGRHGRYRIRVPAGPSRLLRVAYRSHVNDRRAAARVDLRQRVRAGLTLRVLEARIGLHGVAHFSGVVHGGFIPRHGKIVELEAFDASRWRVFDTVRTTRTGRFHDQYAFTRTTRPRTFRFRARSRLEPGFPYVLGLSRPVRLRVG